MKRFLPAAFAFACAVAAGAERPNLILYITDDQRFDMMGNVTPHLITPEMDRLVEQGVRFENAFVTTSICAASRASILTGLHERTHRYTFMTPRLADSLVDASYPKLLRDAGYRTGYVGKFGVDTREGATARMFDSFVPVGRSPYWKTLPDGSRRHATDIAGDRAIEFIEESVAGDAPFCLTLGFNAPHADDLDPLQYPTPPSAAELYRDLNPPPPPNGSQDFYDQLPAYLRDGTMNRDRWQWRFSFGPKRREMTRGYYRLISGADQVIGRIREALESAGVADETVILLIGDNGYFLGERGYAGKWLPHEPSIRVPLVMMDPRGEAAGRKPERFALNIDVPATLLDLAGVDPPAGMSGRSLVPLARGEAPEDWRRHVFIEHLMMHPRIRKFEGVRSERYKYARYFEANPVLEELYDLDSDPGETTNLVNHPEHAEALKRMRRLTREDVERYGGEFSARLWKQPR